MLLNIVRQADLISQVQVELLRLCSLPPIPFDPSIHIELEVRESVDGLGWGGAFPVGDTILKN